MSREDLLKKAEQYSARRVQRDGRIVVLPPLGHGETWVGAAGAVPR